MYNLIVLQSLTVFIKIMYNYTPFLRHVSVKSSSTAVNSMAYSSCLGVHTYAGPVSLAQQSWYLGT